jgi:hypothetical protein
MAAAQVYWEGDTGREEAKEGEKKRGRGVAGVSRGSFSASKRQAGGGTPARSSPATQVLEVADIGGFAKSPLALEDFSEKN